MKSGLSKMLLFVVCLGVTVVACTKHSEDRLGGGENRGTGDTTSCSGVAKSFATDVSPIIKASCSECHGDGSIEDPGALTTYTQIFNSRASIRSAVSSGFMPENGELTAAQKNAILCWIDSGAPNN